MSRLILKGFRRHGRWSEGGSTQNLILLVLLAAGFIILVSALAGFALAQVKSEIKDDVGEALQIVLQSAHESLNLWVESNQFHLARLAEDPRIVFLTERQLGVPRRKNALIKSDALRELRNFFNPRRDQFGQAGFSIISPDFINIASMRDDNLGAKNVIANQALDLLNHAFRGHNVMVPPVWSDIPLRSSSTGKPQNTPTMFFAAPVKTIRDEVIAVLTQRVDPSIDFSRLIQLGKIGRSGETFAFDRYGKLLSDSRFEDDLRRAGLIAEGQKSILSVSLRDPGGDISRDFSPAVPRYQQPLTRMAQQATTGKGGLNVQGYRDYRGVPVYGAWLWNTKLQIGLATKIDETEALDPFYTTRTVILTVLGITVFLALGSLVFAVVIEESAGRALQKSHDELEFRVEERTAELQESRATARGLLDATRESLLLLDKEGLIIAVNQTAARRQQQTPAKLVGTNPFDKLPQDLCESRTARFKSVLETGKPADFEDVRDEMVFHNFYYPVQDKTGEMMGVAIFAQEITERKHMEEDLTRKMEELEEFSKLAIGRELKMIQLKQEINEFLAQLGQEEKYEIVQ
jgi:polar amino acid transport system substrate-binding protein